MRFHTFGPRVGSATPLTLLFTSDGVSVNARPADSKSAKQFAVKNLVRQVGLLQDRGFEGYVVDIDDDKARWAYSPGQVVKGPPSQ